MGRKMQWGLLILAVIAFVSPGLAVGQEKTPPQAPKAATLAPPPVPAATPDPQEMLRQAFDFLKNQPQFSFKAAVTDDRVYNGGRKLQYGLDIEAFFKRPDRLRINGAGDLENKELIFDGKTLTLYDKNKNFYGVMDNTGDLDAALDKAHKDYGLHVGLAELGSNHLMDYATQGLTNALYVGLHKVQGMPCHHLAFDKENVHFQIWIDAGEKPLLRKVVVTQKKLPYAPQWTAVFSDWNFSPQFPDDLFTFTPPAGAQKINFMPLKKAKAPAAKGKKPKKQGGAS